MRVRRLLPHLKPGQAFQTLLENSLTLMAAGFDKGEAMAIALNVAGYRPPAAHPWTSMTCSSTVH